MKYVLSGAVFTLMVSIGMSLRLPELAANWKSLTWQAWLRLLLATFVIPPAVVLALARILPLTLSETGGLFMVAVAPGAPLMTRNIARRGFDMHLAASYQVWGALLIPVMIPLTVAAAGKLYDRDIWIPPLVLLREIAEKQFLPLVFGIVLMYLAPKFCIRARSAINWIGNVVLNLLIIGLLVKMGPALAKITPWVVVAALVLAVCCIAAVRLVLKAEAVQARTLSVCNVNRHVGLALLLSGEYLHNRNALPAIASYAIIVAVILTLAPRLLHQREAKAREAGASTAG